MRATGVGAAAAVGRIGGIIGPFLTPTLAAPLGQSGVFAVFMGLLLLTAAAVGLLSEETRGRSLEEIAPAA